MIKIENVVTPSGEQWDAIIMGMRNPKNSWDRMDSYYDLNCDGISCNDCPMNGREACDILGKTTTVIGPNDHKLMSDLARGGAVHAKYRRMITVYLDITAPLYWWKEFDTYKVGTVSNSCSTMHKIHEKEFTLEDFSHEHLFNEYTDYEDTFDLLNNHGVQDECCPTEFMKMTCGVLNFYRQRFLETKDKKYWWQMIQLLPSSYNQKRTIMLNYEVLVGMYRDRKTHKLDEWETLCSWIKSLPYSEIITGEE